MAPRSPLVSRLLLWYRRQRRDLPWRATRDPYRIWLSEAMLQQTRVEAATAYYERFVAALPTLDDLARAPLDQVLALWSGLGYYQRARALHGAARECRASYGGEVPDDPDAFGALPGVGPYTRAAVMSIAYDRPLAVVDGNVVRVIARLRALPGGAKSALLRTRVQTVVDGLVPERYPGDFNQAMMELGATVCVPRRPRCGVCPLRRDCAAVRSGTPEAWPRPGPRKVARAVAWAAVVIERRGRVLLARRAETGRFRGMWELPWIAGDAAAIAAAYGLELELGDESARIRHAVLDERITLSVRRAALGGRVRGPRFAWVSRGDLADYALSSLWRKAIAATGAAGGADPAKLPPLSERSGRRRSRAGGDFAPPSGRRGRSRP